MVLTLLWRDRCRPITSVPPGLRRYLGALRFPLVLLSCEDSEQRVRVALGDDAVMPGLTLADALCQELDILVEDQAVVVLIPHMRKMEPGMELRIIAELLHALMLREAPRVQQVPALFEWCYRSLSSAWLTTANEALLRGRDDAMAEVLGFPAQRAKLSLGAYLRLLDPQHLSAATDPCLGRRLARCATLADWQKTLWASFDKARCRSVVNLRQN